MISKAFCAVLVAAGMAFPAVARDTVGVFGTWGAFTDADPARCFAIASPLTKGEAFASVATWPGRGARNQLHLHLSRPRAGFARVTLSIGERRFELIAGPHDAWAPDARTDAAIVAAIRAARSMSVETVAAGGQPFADTYPLAGAATAIDAAALACLRR